MPVFISYRHKDRETALVVDYIMKQNGIKTYLDVLDSQSQTTDQITEVITARMKDCTHLIAVVSENTEGSWWVPFEIGEATIIDNRIATFQKDNVSLPDYLKKWPKMKTTEHLSQFAIAYKSDRKPSLEAFGKSLSTAARTADDFHDLLKRKIGQIY